MIGRTLAHYQISAALGAGGMGEVYRATDTKLGRAVAIKVLPTEVAMDAERLARFEREARLLASLNHPGIAHLYGFEAAILEDGAIVHLLAMELVEGEDLSERLKQGSIPIDETIGIAKQVAEALEAAHEKGIVHRDLKPSNIKVTPSGKVKVLDFGLAKVWAGDSARGTSSSDLSLSPTLTQSATAAGLILGTAAYMSPEQARGKAVDKKTDIWAFGVVLWEMLSGKRLFAGETVSDVLAAVLRGEPDWAALPPATPGAVRRVLRRCLEKDPERRLHDMADARLEMDDVRAATDVDPQGATARPLAGRFLPWAVAAILGVVAALGWSGLWTRRAPQTRDLLHAAVMLPEDLDLCEGAGGVQILAISADAKRLVFAARREDMIQLYLRSLDSPDVVEIPGTVGAAMPFFSPDGTWIAFFVGGKLKKVAVQGGTPISLCDAPSPRGGTWIDDDTILLSPTFTSGLAVVSAAGGEPKLLTKPDPAKNERSHRWPTILPGRKAALFTIGTLDKPGDYEDAVIAVADLASGQSHTVVEGASMALFAPPDHLIYSRGGALFSVPFDPVGRRVTGSPATVLQGVAGDRSSGLVHFALAADGTLAYMPTGKGTRDGKLAWVDREGRVEDLPSEPRLYRNLRLSPDGKRLALNIGPGPGDNDTWIYDFDRNALTRFTFDQASYHPLWTLDGRRIVFAATTGGHEGVAWKAADGSEERRMILSQSGIYTPAVCAWVPGHNELVFSRLGGHGGSDLLSIIPGETEAKTVLDTPYLEGGATFSPDGKWMAYCSNESGRLEIYVCAYPPTAGKWQISTSGGRGPCWSHDGREIFYTLGRKMMAVEVATIPTFAPGRPRQLFEFPFDRFIGAERDYDVTPDGRRFIFVRPQSPAPRQIDLVLGLSMKRRP